MDKHLNAMTYANAKVRPAAPVISPDLDPIEDQAFTDLRMRTTVRNRLAALLDEAEALSPMQDESLLAYLPQSPVESAPQSIREIPTVDEALTTQDLLSTLSLNDPIELSGATAINSATTAIHASRGAVSPMKVATHATREAASQTLAIAEQYPTAEVWEGRELGAKQLTVDPMVESPELRMNTVLNTHQQQLKLANKIAGTLLTNIKDVQLQQAIMQAVADVHTLNDRLDELLAKLNHDPASVTHLAGKPLWQSYSRISKANRCLDDYLHQRHSAMTNYRYKADVMPHLQAQLADYLHQRQLNMNLIQEETQLVADEAARQLVFQVSDQRVSYPYYLTAMLPEEQVDSGTLNSLLIHLYTAPKLNTPKLFDSKGVELDLYLGFSLDDEEYTNIEDLNLRAIRRSDTQRNPELVGISLQDLADYRRYLAILSREPVHQVLQEPVANSHPVRSNYCLNPVVPIERSLSPSDR